MVIWLTRVILTSNLSSIIKICYTLTHSLTNNITTSRSASQTINILYLFFSILNFRQNANKMQNMIIKVTIYVPMNWPCWWEVISSIQNQFYHKIWGSDHTTRSRSCSTTTRLACQVEVEVEVEVGVLAWPRLLPSSRGWAAGKQQGREWSVRSFCWRLGICSCFSQFILLPLPCCSSILH